MLRPLAKRGASAARLLLWAAALVAATSGCRGERRESLSDQARAEVEQWRFPHGKHSDLTCTECHEARAVERGEPARPGAADHEPCDREQCHRSEFVARPGPFCTHCHTEVDPTGSRPSTLAPYPPELGRRLLAAEFDHQLHLNADRMESKVGFHVECLDCHELRPDGTYRSPGHAACRRCHATEAAPEGAPPLGQCDACHRTRPRPPRRGRKLIVGDLRFLHGNHTTTRDTRPIECVQCHSDATTAAVTGTLRPPPTSVCTECHDDPARTPVSLRMRVCENCHLGRAESFGSLAPRSHLPPLDTPANHTLAFRTDHATEARLAARQCARCHTEMSGSPRAACDECHQVMRPRSHNISWTEFDHGPQAAVDAQPCATCHAGGFCVACHSRPPRSHFPLGDFARGGHAALADVNLRSCFVCHPSGRDCTTAGCHTGGPSP